MTKSKIAIASHVGGRDEQQDSAKSWSTSSTHLIVVADGVGGIRGGAAASAKVIQCADDLWNEYEGKFPDPKDDLTRLARTAHESIAALGSEEKRAPASTIVALYLDGDQAHWVHCGDSRLYLFRGREKISVTYDHSVVQMLVDQGKLKASELNSHPDKGRLLKSLGASSFKGVDYNTSKVTANDRFWLCSDGYWESSSDNDLLFPPISRNDHFQEDLDHLVKKATDRNGPESDNTTLACLQFANPKAKKTPPQKALANDNRPVLVAIAWVIILLDIFLVFYLLTR